MAVAKRNLEDELDTVKADLDTLRKGISSLVSSFGDAATDEVKTRGRRARAAVGRVTDRAGEVWDDVANEASRRGREGVAAVGQQIEERPFISLLTAFGIGLVIGKLSRDRLGPVATPGQQDMDLRVDPEGAGAGRAQVCRGWDGSGRADRMAVSDGSDREELARQDVIRRPPQRAAPTRAPMPAVNAIASAPQKVTRNVALRTYAPPARAPIAPSRPRNTSDAIDTTGTSIDVGETRTTDSGNTAPVAKVPADVRAAWTGRAVVTSEIPSSSRAWAPSASFAIN